MAKLSPNVKRYIVTRLACYDTVAEVRAALKEELGVDVTYQAVAYYDPTHKASHDLAKDLRDLFEQTRKRFLDKVGDMVPLANRSVRLRKLDLMAHKAIERKNYVLAGQLMEQIAKETGGKYTNVVKIGDEDPVKALAEQLNMSPEEVAAALSGDPGGDTSTAGGG
jgi:hypothetical protein